MSDAPVTAATPTTATHLLHAVTSFTDMPDPSMPVALFLHGFGTDEGDLPGLAPLILPPGMPWASLRAPLALPTGGFAWFPIERPGDPRPEPIERATAAVWHWTDAMLPADARVVPIGFSQGGLMAVQLLRTRPDRVARPVSLSGFALSAAQPADEALAETRPPAFWGHGDADPVITPAAVARTAAWLAGHTADAEHRYAGMGHTTTPEELADVHAFLAPLAV